MSKIVIAVGGTGQEIALSCLRLSHMAGLTPPTVLVVDSDQGVGKQGVLTRTDELQRLGGFLNETYAGKFVEYLVPFTESIRERKVDTLRSLFSPAGLTPPSVQDILSLLLTQTQQDTAIIDGFHGHPAVGAFAVADYMLQPQFQEQFVNSIDTLTKPDVKHFVVLAGSTTGGTGPGSIPPLSRQLVRWRGALNGKRKIEISGVVQLQWFEPLEDDKVTWSHEPDIDVTRLQQNSACLVRQYDAELATLMDRLVLLGLPVNIRRVSAGPNHQPETRHWLNLLSGWITAEMLTAGPGLEQLPAGSLYGYALEPARSPLVSLSFHNDGQEITVGGAVAATRILVAFGRGLSRQMSPAKLDPALPKPTYRVLGALLAQGRGAVREFLDTFKRLTDMDETMLAWFGETCASRIRPTDPSSPRDDRDVPGAFMVPSSELATEFPAVGALLTNPKALEHDFVAYLLAVSNIQPGPEGPRGAALSLYRNLKLQLLTGLVKA